ncbi:MAG: hypothetical protein LUB61_07460, partial [Eggerthellaceae bacterium]|nr:hypothetical protein [Eggerthellaceae bacterium]
MNFEPVTSGNADNETEPLEPSLNPDCLERISFLGNVLAPFFLEDPETGRAGELFKMFSTLDPQTAAMEWPFVETRKALESLSSMKSGLCNGIDEKLIWGYRTL